MCCFYTATLTKIKRLSPATFMFTVVQTTSVTFVYIKNNTARIH